MNKIQRKVMGFLTKALTKSQKVDEDLISLFEKRCGNALRKQFLQEREKDFRLRMSNVGRPTRQLMLEKIHGEGEKDPEFKRLVLYGDIVEAIELFLIEASGIKIEEEDKEVVLQLDDYSLMGTYDVKIDGKIYDIKSASPWSFDNKFTTFDNMVNSYDPFGYIGQGFGYAEAEGCKFGGWIVVNKVNGKSKVVEVPDYNYKKAHNKQLKNIKKKVDIVLNDKWDEIEECPGVEEETFYGKDTGEKYLGISCTFCEHKYKCHPGLVYCPDRSSKAKNPKWKYYLKD